MKTLDIQIFPPYRSKKIFYREPIEPVELVLYIEREKIVCRF
jgi:hypothetical protein